MPKAKKARDKARRESLTQGRRSTTVLVVDDSNSDLRKAGKLLETFRMIVLTAGSTTEAFQAAGSTRIDVAVVDWLLGDHDDGIALGQSLRRDYGIPFILFSRYLDTEATGRAYKLGAADVLDKPIRPGRLLAAVRLALGHRQHLPSTIEGRSIGRGADSVSMRLAMISLKACHSERDPRTEPDVAAAAGISTSVYQRDCHECGVKPSALRDLVRLLWANAMAGRDGSTLRSHLGTCDPRTCRRLFERAGVPIDSRTIAPREFFVVQRLVPSDNECLRDLAHLVANDPLFFVDFESDEQSRQTKRA